MKIAEILFNYRSYTPIPILVAVLYLAEPAPLSLAAGFCLAVAGELLRLWAVRHAGGATRTTSGVGGSTLITHGPYAHVRNPLYVGNFLLSTGLVIMAWPWMPWMLLLFWALFALQYGLIISLEEAYLRETFGATYAAYCQNVPRVVPRLLPAEAPVARPMPWKKAIRVEKNTLTSFILVSLAIVVRWQM